MAKVLRKHLYCFGCHLSVSKIIILFSAVMLISLLIATTNFYNVLPVHHPSYFKQEPKRRELVDTVKIDHHTTPLLPEKLILNQIKKPSQNKPQQGKPTVVFKKKKKHLNITETIKSVLQEQKLLIEKELRNYSFEEKLRGRKISNLSDLVLSHGGVPVRNLVVTTWRSGSTFVGDLLNNHPGTFYHYEPLLPFEIVQVRNGQMAAEAITLLKDLMMCNYTYHGDYLKYGKKNNWLFNHNTRLWTQCRKHPEICWKPQFLNTFCKLFPFQSIKTVRLRLRLSEELLEDPRFNIRLLYLVRDPRGTMQSRNHRDWCPGNPDCDDPYHLCNDLVTDYHAAEDMKDKYKDRIKIIRYEDMALDIYNESRKIFEFFDLEFSKNIKHFLDTHTQMNKGGVSSTFRDSKSAPLNWRTLLDWNEVETIQSACDVAMKLWGYNKVNNKDDLTTFNPRGKLDFHD